ncbi:hypothetical protein C5167_024705 [Papaver somniferum]|uniref:Neprosin PEP catalytic domain-containing protein n=1 Tax=Papaver somniferum TaxID=3469 RepID=A0A4Y7JSG2_PAPSO|nr:uncharacterized protein LOC113278132 isoform X1 [Papaver somniferum]RZC62962.1 hypothetical protein C5167_024705 [Papaver somniferum]
MSKFINSPSRLFLLAIFIYVVLTPKALVDARRISNAVNKSIIKTIQVDNDEIIDCYDIFKQPSLDHPSLRNHTIQMRPSVFPKNTKLDNLGTLQLTQTWHKYGTCPHGTIPIRRNTRKHYDSTLFRKQLRPKPFHSKKPNTLQPNEDPEIHEYAVIKMRGSFIGAQAKINLWNPTVESSSEMSVSQIWVEAGPYEELNTIEAGWTVDQFYFNDTQTRFFIMWTGDGYKHGCVNLLCPGFVQTSSEIGLGCNFTEVSTFKGGQKDATFSIHKDQNSGNWWVQLQGISVGYYPSSIFKLLSKTADHVEFGGEITNARSNGRHTTTQMGSGHYPLDGGLGISSYFSHVQVMTENNEIIDDPVNVQLYTSNPNCYDLKVDEKRTNGYSFYYGGSGYNDKCQQ